ncbi:MAG: exo-alpha-sialidase [Verrucomicrobia bacterium]|nr:exo-alpha-sialidase [Verrucomicrobiota bacterium]
MEAKLFGLILLAASYLDAVTVSEPLHITGISRMPDELSCLQLNNPLDLTGFNYYKNVGFDPQLSVNPTNHKNMIIVAQQDTLAGAEYNTALPLSVIVMYTIDGGRTWNQSDLSLSRCQGASNYKANNNFSAAYFPTVTFDSDGNCYVLIMGYNIFAADHQQLVSLDEGTLVAKSLDGGITWNEITTLNRDDGSCHFTDFPFIKANLHKDHTAYAVYSDNTCFVFDTCEDPNFNGNQYILFQKSVDEGASWTQPSIIATFEPENEDICTPIPALNQLEVLPNNTLVVSSLLQTHSPDDLERLPYDRLYVWRSKNDGLSWKRHIVTEEIDHVLVVDPDSVDPILPVTDFTTKDMALNHCNGYLYMAYSDPQFNPTGRAGAVIRKSTDGGKSWSKPRPVNPNSLDAQAFLPTIAVAKDGTIGVLFYDMRNFKSGAARLDTDVWLPLFDKDLHHLDEIRLTAESFDTRLRWC